MVATTVKDKRAINQHKQNKDPIIRAKNFMKRKECVKRKTRELSVLCDINTCVVILGPNGQVDTWPENPDNVREIISMYQDFSAKNRCKSKRAFEPSAKVGQGVGNVPDFQDFLRKIESKLEALEKRKDFLNESKGKEVAVSNGEEAEFNQMCFTELRNLPEVETSDSQGIKTPQLEAISEQSIPCSETLSEQNLFENPQFCNSMDNSEVRFLKETSTDHGIAQNIPLQSNLSSPPDHHGRDFLNGKSDIEKQNVQFPNHTLWFDASTYESRMMNLMRPGLYPQLQDCMSFPRGAFVHPTALTPFWFAEGAVAAANANAGQTIIGSLPQLCPLPQQAFEPVYYSWQPLIYQPFSSSSSLQHQNLRYPGFWL